MPLSNRFTGHFDGLVDGMARGWAIDGLHHTTPTWLHVLIDGQEVGRIECNAPRNDVQEAGGLQTNRVGFEFALPDTFVDGQPHTLSLRFPDRLPLPMELTSDGTPSATEITFTVRTVYQFNSYVDGYKHGALRGWVQRINPRTGERTGGCEIAVTMDGVRFTQCRADRYRGDVAAAVGGDPNCGFEIRIPPQRKRTGQVTFRFTVVPDDVELDGGPIVTSIVEDALEGKLLDLTSTVERLHREIKTLRSALVDLLPTPGFTLGDYDRWARQYYPALRERVAAERALRGPSYNEPLVSVICPTYKPEMPDFTAAVDSVLNQTYRNWELLIVDDGGKCPATAARIKAYSEQDSRIRPITLKKNVGIAGATNAGIEAAKGEWIAFFDHDDLLVDVALEVMIARAKASHAEVLYSDEDKIDQAGYFLEPNLKPDFNYRYLLGCNYICHLLVVRRDVLDRTGALATRYDGAQDHDLILRLTETVPHDRILHVPEVLYHWRKTANSTAVRVDNKTYAIDSGIRAVGDHLKRLGHKAKVSSIRGLTLYHVGWAPDPRASVTIIIPFKDQIETTRECVERVLTKTKHKKFDVILVDNWSVTQEARDFCALIERDPRVSVLRVEEDFNFSRLNNLAAVRSTSDFLFFMNNDLFVDDPNWLSIVIAEAQSDPNIAAVGGKFFYPNGMIQHVGVAVGPAGIAAHVHRGLPDGDYGYIGRAVLSHDVTAVTAAGMLVRRACFEAVGGFDEKSLTVAYNDVDLCLKLRSKGWRIIQCNEFTAVHHESLSRGSDDRPEHEARFFRETQALLDRWGQTDLFRRDPAYSPHFTVDLQTFYDLTPPVRAAAAADIEMTRATS
ncbi:glycosyltransferase family 2 protein [Ameyamaea chiangmaiensis]|uniref:Glycosyltransferase family 2 protein n=1 Tax=Ameyamaea chiangmaiensis TaxID=442969 RepID=A0A850PF85_9PROT|nr:glycosyltransferase family 2 protein [Ameyamaea chiangmaiensis]MBS4075943.1 glycosyltransferase family 2 protein [Ameyamaea chiangmaiensis]NVN39771.1 glycosyltransferase family 2 protein [Ameyamaea chiangmaiensis]